MSQPKCETCRWWDGVAEDEIAECRRLPPQFIIEQIDPGTSHGDHAFWPLVDSDQWCGEHQPKEQSDDV